MDACRPCLDPDSTHPSHRGGYSLPPFQTHSRYLYATLGKECCGRNFVNLYYQQHHPFPHCNECARLVLGATSHICWQCRTYFRRYGNGYMQQIIGITPQRHSFLEMWLPERGSNQRRLPDEEEAQHFRDDCIEIIRPPIIQALLPQPSRCQFWNNVSDHLDQFQGGPCLVHLPTVPMPYYSDEALRPLPSTPRAGYLRGLSLYPEAIDDALPANEEDSQSSNEE